MQTPAAIVPAYPPDPAPDPGKPSAARQLPDDQASRSKQCDQAGVSSYGLDTPWQQKYNQQGGQHLWFQFTPQQLAAWYNHRHDIAQLLSPERTGMCTTT